MISREFVLSGKAVFVVELPKDHSEKYSTPDKMTYSVWHMPASNGYPECWTIGTMNHPREPHTFRLLGTLNTDTGKIEVAQWSGVKWSEFSVRVAERVLGCVFKGQGDKIAAAGWDVKHTGNCGKCGAVLTTPESVRTGLGPICGNRVATQLASKRPEKATA